MSRPALLLALAVGVAGVLVRRRGAARRDESALWAEAAVAPDLR